MDNTDTLSMSGIIHVKDAASIAYSLNVEIGGYSPLYNPRAGKTQHCFITECLRMIFHSLQNSVVLFILFIHAFTIFLGYFALL